MDRHKISKTVEITGMEVNGWDSTIYYVEGGYYGAKYEITINDEGVVLSSAWNEIETFNTMLEAITYLDKQ